MRRVSYVVCVVVLVFSLVAVSCGKDSGAALDNATQEVKALTASIDDAESIEDLDALQEKYVALQQKLEDMFDSEPSESEMEALQASLQKFMTASGEFGQALSQARMEMLSVDMDDVDVDDDVDMDDDFVVEDVE